MNGDIRARRPGEIVGGKYRITRLLAEGGMGVVYEAQHTLVKRRFAVKFLRPELAERRENMTRFQREAQTAGALESEHVTAAMDFGVAQDGSPYIVMEFLAGESLASLLERELRLPIERATDLVVQACRGIQAAHAVGIVHRDLKPHNLFVCRREDATDLLKVLDFGIAKLEASEASGDATRTGTIMGTPAYMSPEQARGERTIDHRTDVYALGAILYELLSGRKPHPGESHNAVLHHISTQPAVPLTAVMPDSPAELAGIVDRSLASDPRARPDSADELARELSAFSKRQVWPAPEARITPEPSEPSSTLLADGPFAGRATPAPNFAGSGDRQGSAPPGKRRPFVLLAAGIGVVALLIFGVFQRERPAEEVSSNPGGITPAHAEPTRRMEPPAEPEVRAERQAIPPSEPPPLASPGTVPIPPGRPSGRPAGRPPEARGKAPSRSVPAGPASAPAPLAFDSKNPYE